MQTTPRRSNPSSAARLLIGGALLAAMAGAGGCALFRGDDAVVEGGEQYPFELPRGEVADVQVFRDGTRLRMTNATSTDFGAGTLWLNQRFSREIEGFAPGDRLNLDLYEFKDEFGQSFRGGGFFSTRDPDAVVLVEHEAGERLVGFIVVQNEMD